MAKRSQRDHAKNSPWRQWHRLFGVLLTDHLKGSSYTVELEKDLSLKRQMLDVAIVRRGPGPLPRLLPDGFDELVEHNLITFKSFWEPLDDWALKELTGYYVSYRKQVSSPGKVFIPEDHFQLFAVCARNPRELLKAVPHKSLKPGVYQVLRGSDLFRVVVAGELPQTERNALLHLFSAHPDQVKYGAEHYRWDSDDASSIVNQLFEEYRLEGLTMPYTMEDFRRDFIRKHLRELKPEEVLAQFSPEEVLARYSPEEVLARYSPEEVLARYSPEERLTGLGPEDIEAYLRRARGELGTPRKRKKKSQG